ncbi:MAG: hypothetical protein PVF95_02720 [bacterium]
MKKWVIAIAVLATMVFAAQAFALERNYFPSSGDLNDLPHDKYYTWGVDISEFAGYNIYEVILSIYTISNWDNSENHLYLHLLDDAPLGVTQGSDNDDVFVDAFAGQGAFIDDWQDLNGKYAHEDLHYEFSKIDALMDSVGLYRANNVIAIGFDPDCHFYNCYIQLTVKGEPPNAVEPTSWGEIKARFQE